MIKVAITGAATPEAGELIRILTNHPEVELTTLSAPGYEGISVTSVHHGLIGELKLNFSGPLSMTPDCSVVFVCGNSMTAAEFSALRLALPDIRIIIVGSISNLDTERLDIVYGLPEINRKPLVRGALSAIVPSPMASIVLTSLYPLAQNLLLNDSVRIQVEAPADIIANDKGEARKEITENLSQVQLSLGDIDNIEFTESSGERRMKAVITLSCPISTEQIDEIYEMYDDHNFAFPVFSQISDSEVAGTDKCVIYLRKEDDSTLRIETLADPRMRGGAGEAVHIMNLLFGLAEKTGLALKASEFSSKK